jgi:hypothetical protein
MKSVNELIWSSTTQTQCAAIKPHLKHSVSEQKAPPKAAWNFDDVAAIIIMMPPAHLLLELAVLIPAGNAHGSPGATHSTHQSHLHKQGKQLRCSSKHSV